MNVTKWDFRFLRLAQLVASWSKDTSTQTGAVIVGPNKRVVSIGFNGFPQGMSDSYYLYSDREEKYSRIIHCEVNALLFAGQLPPDATLYTVPFMSCDRCVVQMLQAGIKNFVTLEASDDAKSRWGTSFDRTRKYVREAGCSLKEIPTLWLGHAQV